MEQVRAILNVLLAQRFWVLGLIGMIVGTVCWNMATTDLQGQFKSRKSAIDSAFSTVSSIKREFTHPNDNVNEGDKKQARQQRGYVLKKWQDLYDRQRTRVTKWPESLGAEFIGNMQDKKFGDRISPDDRGFYLDYIEKRFDGLLEIVSAKKSSGQGVSGGGGFGRESGRYSRGPGGGGAAEVGRPGGRPGVASPEEEDYLVLWLDQANLQQKLSFSSTPTTMQVWVTQEDLWVYETLLHVIAKTNQARGAKTPDTTAVGTISELQVGSEAADKSNGKILIPSSQDRGGGSPYGDGGTGRPFADGRPSSGSGGVGRPDPYGGRPGRPGSGRDSAVDDSTLVANRYLDESGDPVAVTPGSYGSTEFRKLPVRMKLIMDQRWVPRLLIECANAALPVEVKQVRINPEQSGDNASRNAAKELGSNTNLATVEIRGVVYIYNQPDTTVLAIPGDEDADSSEDAI